MLQIFAVGSLLAACCMGSELHPEYRISSGNETNGIIIPYQVSIEFMHAHRCSGTIIEPSWILTVANCLADVDPAELNVRADAPLRGILGEFRGVSLYILHPQYDPENMDYDIALIKVTEDLPFNDTINSINIATNVPFDGNIAKVSGWGAPFSGAWLSDTLNEQEVSIVYFNECQYVYEGIGNKVTERMICARGSGGPCEGDSGDPLVYKEELIGISSWSFGCHGSNYPGIYTDVTMFREWITSILLDPF